MIRPSVHFWRKSYCPIIKHRYTALAVQKRVIANEIHDNKQVLAKILHFL
jgi:hypothetical protein